MKKPFALGATTVASAVGISLLSASPAYSQGTGNEDSGGLQEIVVTARYREENLQQTPIAITAITAQDIEARGFDNAAEIAYSVPNASFRPAQAAFGNTMTAFIRGIGQNDFLPEFEPGVGVYFDDVLYPVTMGSMVDLMDLERVEVLRGPQGTLFGRGSIGGAIRYVSKKPTGDNSGNVSVTYGRYDRVDVRGTYDFALTDNVFARVTGVSKRRDGYQDVYDFACINPGQAGRLPVLSPNRNAGCKLGTQGGEDVTGARASIRFVATDDLEFQLTGDYMNDESEVRADTLLGVTGPGGAFGVWSENYLLPVYGVRFDNRFVPTNRFVSYATYMDPRSGLAFQPKTSLQQDGISGKMDWKITDGVRMELIGSYREFEGEFATDADQSPVNEQTVNGHPIFNSRSAELRFSGRILDRADWTVGTFFYNGHFHNAQVVSIPALIFAGVYGGAIAGGASVAQAQAAGANVIDNAAKFLVNGNNLTDSENKSAFAHVVYDINDRLSVTGGVRYSKDQKDERFDNTIVRTALNTDENNFDWKAGVDYKFTDTVLGYVSAATGYRPQSFNPRPFQRTQFVQVDGESAKSYEVGMKGDFLERRLRANVAAFYIDFEQRIVGVGGVECLLAASDPGSGPPVYDTVPAGTPNSVTDALGNVCLSTRTTSRTFYQNSPGKIKGGELELTFRPIDALTISGSYGYTDFTADDLNAPNILIRRPAYVPKSNWTVGAMYEFGFSGGSSLTPRVDVYSQSEICTGVTSRNSCSEGYDLLNARLEWASPDRSWTTAVGVNNLTNEDYFYNKFDLSAFGQPTTEGQPGSPTEWYISFTRNF